MEHMSHEQYVAMVRDRMVSLARSMLNGETSFLDGAVQLASLGYSADLDSQDKDLAMFVLISSEVDHLPIGEYKKNWSTDALQKHQLDIDEATEWAKQFGDAACRSIIERFHTSVDLSDLN